MQSQKIRIRLKAFDHKLLDQSTREIVDTARRTGARIRRDGDVLLIPGPEDGWPRQLAAWLKWTARAEAEPAINAYATSVGRPWSRLTLRDPKSRWGSCTADGGIMLSWRLTLAPREVFNYVAAHEVAHLVEMNHSPAFWAVVERLDPDHQTSRAWLRREGAALHRIKLA